MIGGMLGTGTRGAQRRVVIAVGRERLPTAKQVCVGDEEREIVRGEKLFDPPAAPADSALERSGRWGPLVARPVAALGQPDAAWRRRKVPQVRAATHA